MGQPTAPTTCWTKTGRRTAGTPHCCSMFCDAARAHLHGTTTLIIPGQELAKRTKINPGDIEVSNPAVKLMEQIKIARDDTCGPSVSCGEHNFCEQALATVSPTDPGYWAFARKA